MTKSNEDLAQANLAALRSNPYPGRGIVAGLDETSQYLVQVYWIMGRSENSRNRVLKTSPHTGQLYIEPADAAKMKDPSLIIYHAMREMGQRYIVSNGDQTDTVAEYQGSSYLNVALKSRLYEPDEPHFTQRITAVSSLAKRSKGYVQMSILRKSVFGETRDSSTYEYISYPGFGHCITTYAGDGSPLPSFRGDPLIMPIRGGLQAVAETYWDALNVENRVSLAVKFIDKRKASSDIHIINKYEQLPIGV